MFRSSPFKSIITSIIFLSQVITLTLPLTTHADEVGYDPQPTQNSGVVVDGIGHAGNGQVSVMTGSTGSPQAPTDLKLGIANKGQVDKASGAFTYEYPLNLPSGRKDLSPELSLNYDSRRRNYDTYTGLGWELQIPSIKRLNKEGADVMFDHTDFSSTKDGELVKIDGVPGQYGTYGIKQGYGRYTYTADNEWITTNKDGITYVYGNTARHRKQDAANNDRVTEWMLSEIHDPFGNKIVYDYTKSRNTIFPDSINYVGQGIKVLFSYTDLYNADTKTDYIDNFLVTPDRALKEIDVVSDTRQISYTFTINQGLNGYATLTGITGPLGTQTFAYKPFNADTLGTPALGPYTDYGPSNGFGGLVTGVQAIPVANLFADSGAPVDQQICYINQFNDGGCEPKNAARFMDINGDGYTDFTYVLNGMNRIALFDPVLSKFVLHSELDYPAYANTDWQDYASKLVDIDGDGKLDRYTMTTHDPNDGTQTDFRFSDAKWYRQTQTGWQPMTLTLPSQFSLKYNAKSAVLADINRDGYTDIMIPTNTTTKAIFFLGTGTGFTYQSDMTIVGGGDWTNIQYFTWRDVNGDNKLDLIRISDVVAIYLNRNSSFYYSPAYSKGPGYTNDFNNDGLGESGGIGLSATGDPAYGAIQFNTGAGYSPLIDTKITSIKSVYGFKEMWGSGSSPSTLQSPGYDAHVIMDFNHDGYQDVWYSRGNGAQQYLYIVPTNRAGLISTITNEYGGQTQITYGNEVLKNTNTSGNPETQIVVKSITNLGGTFTDTTSLTYTYQDGMRYYNSEEYQTAYAGFGKVSETDAAGVRTDYYFHQGNASNTTKGEFQDSRYKTGRIYRTETFDASGNQVQLVTTKWNQADLGSGRYFVFPENTVTQTTSGGVKTATAIAYTYDTAYGELVRTHDLGLVTANDDGTFTDTGTDDITTSTYYITNGTLVRVRELKSVGYTGNTLSHTRYTYDSGLTYGLTKTSETEVASGIWAATSYEYNTQGQVTSITDPLGNKTTQTYDLFGMYPASTTNALGQTTTTIYDLLLGKVLYTRDMNGLESSTTYDNVGRPLTFTQDSIVLWTIDYPTMVNGNLGAGHVYQRTADPDFAANYNIMRLVSLTYVNQWGQPWGVSTKGQQTYTHYNNRGLADKVTIPFAEGSTQDNMSSNYFAPGYNQFQNHPEYETWTTYDALSRPTAVTNAYGTTTTQYVGLTTIVTNPAGVKKESALDARGNVLTVTEHNGTNSYVTVYTYDQRNNLTSITDAEGNVRHFSYDFRGLRTATEDLHKPTDTTFGILQNQYDKLGRIVKQVRMDGSQILTTYDALSRPVTVKGYDAPGTTMVSSVTTTYDDCGYGYGHVCKQVTLNDPAVSSAQVTTEYTYDKRGETTSQTLTSPMSVNPSNPSGQATTTYTYSDAGPLLTAKQGDISGTTLGYIYNQFNMPVQLTRNGSNFVSVIYESPTRVKSFTFANGTQTTYTYDVNRVYELTNQKTTTNAGTVQNTTYTRNNLGEITTSSEAAPTVLQKTTTYQYDDLMRLLGLSSQYTAGTTLSRQYTYSPTGNILSATDEGAFTYASGTGNQALVTPDTDQLLQSQMNHSTATVSPLAFMPQYRTPTFTDKVLAKALSLTGANAYADELPTVPSTEVPVTPEVNDGEVNDGPVTPDQNTGTSPSVPLLQGEGGSATPPTATSSSTSTDTTRAPVFTGGTSTVIGTTAGGVQTNLGKNGPGNPIDPIKKPLTLAELLTYLSAHLWQLFQVSGGILIQPYGTQQPNGSTVLLRQDRVGRARILPGDLIVHIKYTSTGTVPVVTLAPTSDIQSDYWVANKTDTGFDLVIDKLQDTPATFDWYAYAIPDDQVPVYVSDGTTLNTNNPPSPTDPFTTPITPTNNPVPPTSNLVNVYADPDAVIQTDTGTQTQKLIYDLSGNVIQYTDPSNHLWQYRYDINDNLIVTKLVNPTDNSIMSMIQYTYDGSGNRVTKSIMNPGTGQPTMTTTYWSDTYETDTDPSSSSGQASRINISLTGQHLATLSIPTNEPSVTSYYHNDPLGTSQVITNQAGTIISAADTLPYGEVNNQTLNLGNNQPKPKDYFALHERDDDTGLVYMEARYYNDSIKRFYSLDPAALQNPEKFIQDPQQLNTYSYARGNPVMYNDPSGAVTDTFPYLEPSDIVTSMNRTVDLSGSLLSSFAMMAIGGLDVEDGGGEAVLADSVSIEGINNMLAGNSGRTVVDDVVVRSFDGSGTERVRYFAGSRDLTENIAKLQRGELGPGTPYSNQEGIIPNTNSTITKFDLKTPEKAGNGRGPERLFKVDDTGALHYTPDHYYTGYDLQNGTKTSASRPGYGRATAKSVGGKKAEVKSNKISNNRKH